MEAMRQIRLSKGLFALVNIEDHQWLSKWNWYASNESRGTKWYAIRRENGAKVRMHVEVLKRRLGIDKIPPGYVVDHVNHNSLDNRFSNYDNCCVETGEPSVQLELVTQAENMRRSPGWKRKGVKVGKASAARRQRHGHRPKDSAPATNRRGGRLRKSIRGHSPQRRRQLRASDKR